MRRCVSEEKEVCGGKQVGEEEKEGEASTQTGEKETGEEEEENTGWGKQAGEGEAVEEEEEGEAGTQAGEEEEEEEEDTGWGKQAGEGEAVEEEEEGEASTQAGEEDVIDIGGNEEAGEEEEGGSTTQASEEAGAEEAVEEEEDGSSTQAGAEEAGEGEGGGSSTQAGEEDDFDNDGDGDHSSWGNAQWSKPSGSIKMGGSKQNLLQTNGSGEQEGGEEADEDEEKAGAGKPIKMGRSKQKAKQNLLQTNGSGQQDGGEEADECEEKAGVGKPIKMGRSKQNANQNLLQTPTNTIVLSRDFKLSGKSTREPDKLGKRYEPNHRNRRASIGSALEGLKMIGNGLYLCKWMGKNGGVIHTTEPACNVACVDASIMKLVHQSSRPMVTWDGATTPQRPTGVVFQHQGGFCALASILNAIDGIMSLSNATMMEILKLGHLCKLKTITYTISRSREPFYFLRLRGNSKLQLTLDRQSGIYVISFRTHCWTLNMNTKMLMNTDPSFPNPQRLTQHLLDVTFTSKIKIMYEIKPVLHYMVHSFCRNSNRLCHIIGDGQGK